jgi:hypothetical protein
VPPISQYRRDLDALTRLAAADLRALWRQVSDAVMAKELLADILPELVAVYGSAAGTLAADWYDDLREEQEAKGRFSAIVAAPAPRAQTDALAGWAAKDLFSSEPDYQGSLTKAQGGLQRLIANVGRETITGSSIEDPRASGWQRVSAGGCGFCEMLASRGAVYSEREVDFGAHDNCRCGAVPVFDGRAKAVEPYTPTSRNLTDADRAATRQWMAEHGY